MDDGSVLSFQWLEQLVWVLRCDQAHQAHWRLDFTPALARRWLLKLDQPTNCNNKEDIGNVHTQPVPSS